MSGVENQDEDKKPAVKMSGVANQDEDKKPGQSATGGARMTLKVKGQDGNEVVFRIKRSAPLHKLMTAYCDHHSVEFFSVRFVFDGTRVKGHQTPDELEMEEGDELDAFMDQIGGYTYCLV